MCSGENLSCTILQHKRISNLFFVLTKFMYCGDKHEVEYDSWQKIERVACRREGVQRRLKDSGIVGTFVKHSRGILWRYHRIRSDSVDVTTLHVTSRVIHSKCRPGYHIRTRVDRHMHVKCTQKRRYCTYTLAILQVNSHNIVFCRYRTRGICHPKNYWMFISSTRKDLAIPWHLWIST